MAPSERWHGATPRCTGQPQRQRVPSSTTGPRQRALTNAAFAATCAALQPRQPWRAMREDEALRALLGRDGELTHEQRLAIDAWKLHPRRDALVHLPCGSGKSLTFLLPALCSNGGALVVSPLRALMRAMAACIIRVTRKLSAVYASMYPRRAAFEAAQPPPQHGEEGFVGKWVPQTPLLIEHAHPMQEVAGGVMAHVLLSHAA